MVAVSLFHMTEVKVSGCFGHVRFEAAAMGSMEKGQSRDAISTTSESATFILHYYLACAAAQLRFRY